MFPPCSLDVGVEEVKKGSFVLYPNPVTDRLFVKIPEEEGNYPIRIFSLSGKLLKSLPASSGSTIMINVSDLKPGEYIITSEKNGVISSSLFVKQ
ncbi:MAG: hypothetical protein CSA04_02890 [Bacteroidetes bacterium]|nr:MAG: hypothetical protein CSA04_02890 [Bacteroidota bacterium]